MDLTTNLKKHETYTLHVEPLSHPHDLEGFKTMIFYHVFLIGEATVYLAPAGLCDETLLTYLDDIELLAVELFDVAQDQKRVAHQIK